MAIIKGQLKLKNGTGSFDVIMPQTEAGLVKLLNGENLETQVMKNIADIAAAQAAADAAQAAADAAQQQADKGVADAAAAKAVADQAVLDAAAAQQQADKGVADAAAAQKAADDAQAAADAAQEQADKGVADAAAAKAIADQAVLDAEAAQKQADKGVADAAAAQQAADKANADLLAIQNGKNKANGFVELDANGLVPVNFIPNEFKEIRIVGDIAGRDAINDKFVGLSVYVKDATADENVAKGGAYYLWDGFVWLKTAESESLDVVLNWAAIEDKPTTIAGYGLTDAVHVDEIVAAPAANKVLRLNADGKLPADVTGNAGTASKLAAKVNIGINGDDVVAAVQEFDGSQAINIPVVLSNTGVTAGTYTKVQVDAKGRVVAAQNLVADDIPNLDWSKINSGKPTTLEGYGIVDGVNKNGDTMTGHLVLHANPVEDMHAATKAYVDSMVQGLDVKESVRVATVENINLNGLQTIDGVVLAAGDRVLVKNQTNAAENGIYVVNTAAWVRANDAVNGKVNPGMFTFVEEGTVNNNNGFVLANDGAVNVGVTELNFAQFSGMGQVLVGNGLGKNGNEIFLTDTGVTAGTYTKVQVDAQGRVVAAQNLAPEDLPEVAWAVITGKPNSAVADIDDAVAKRHEHANKAQLDKVGEADGVMTYDGAKMATQQFAQDYAESMIAVGATEPQNMPTNGLWIQVLE
jgi:phage-related tail fiber protein